MREMENKTNNYGKIGKCFFGDDDGGSSVCVIFCSCWPTNIAVIPPVVMIVIFARDINCSNGRFNFTT